MSDLLAVVARKAWFIDGATRSGGEVWVWKSGELALATAIRAGEVEHYRRAPYHAFPCSTCARAFVTERARDSHRQRAHGIASTVEAGE